MIIVIKLKGAIRDFFTVSVRRELSLTCTVKWPGRSRVQITCSTSGVYYVQHRPAVKFDRIETTSTFSYISLAETINR